MGDHKVNIASEREERIAYISHLITDVEVLEAMLAHQKFESGITRIGAEQEFCIVTNNWHPAKNSTELLAAIDDPHFTTELAAYNLEINLDPMELKGDCFSRVEFQLQDYLKKAAAVASKHDCKVILTGILPTITPHEVGLDFMTPNARYYALNDVLCKLRGSDFRMMISGVDELQILHDSVMFEACNTSFQMHLQIDPEDFISSFNWAQAIAGPVLAACVNSPLLLGRELWSETRIALFQQSIDTRPETRALRDQQARVAFGEGWAEGSIAEIFKHNIARHPIILTKPISQSSRDRFDKGEAPKLEALNLHNGTVYNWNRACYGVGGGKAHVRIENRYIPSGPTVHDEVANFVFWVGLMTGRPTGCDDMPSVMDFREAKSNFMRAAKNGSESVMNWMGRLYTAPDLILDELLPIARNGLQKMKVDAADIDRYLATIEQRVKGNTGSQWLAKSFRKLKKEHKITESLVALTSAMHEGMESNQPVHTWNLVGKDMIKESSSTRLGDIMSTRVVTVGGNDLAELTLQLMEWKGIHHLPVIDEKSRLVGLVTWRHLGQFMERIKASNKQVTVSDIMTKEVMTATPDTPIHTAIARMKEREIGCLPVIQDEHLVGMITIKDLLSFDNA